MKLLIGYGNELRRDDGVGPRVARIVASWRLPHLQVLALHQLTPELVDQMSRVDEVLFVDAQIVRDQHTDVNLQQLGVPAISEGMSHLHRPESLLGLCRVLHERVPIAWLLTIPGADFEFGSEISPIAEEGVREAVRQVREWAAGGGGAIEP